MLQNPSVCRGGTPCTPANLQESLYCCVHHSDVTSEAIAQVLGIKRAYLLAAADPNRGDTHFQSHWLLPLMEVTRNLSPVRFITTALNCALVTLPSPTGPGDAAIYERVADVVRELGEDTATIQRVLSDGEVTTDEVAHVKREIADTIEALLNLQVAVETRSKSLAHPVVSAPRVEVPHVSPGHVKPAPARMDLPLSAPARKAARA